MKPWRFAALVAFVVLALVLGSAAAQRGGAARSGLFAPLQKGQWISLKEKAGAFEINVVPGAVSGRRVVEVGQDYLVVEDLTALTQTRIPIYAVRVITVQRLP